MRYIVACVLGGVAGISIIVPQLWFFIFVGIALTIILIVGASIRGSLAVGFSFGFSFVGVSLLWILVAYPGEWLGVSLVGAIFVVGSVWLVYTVAFSALFALWALCVRLCVEYRVWFQILIGASAWLCAEWFRTTLFSVISWAPGHAFGPHGTVGLSSLALASSDGFLWIARVGDFWLMSVVVYALSATLAFGVIFLAKKDHIRGSILLASPIFVIILSALLPPAAETRLGDTTASTHGVEVALVHTDIPRTKEFTPEIEMDIVAHVAEQLVAILESPTPPRLVILPEDLRFLSRFHLLPTEMQETLSSLFDSRRVVLVDSSRISDNGVTYSAIQVFDYENDATLLYARKSLLAPFGEYIPTFFSAMWEPFSFYGGLREFRHSRDYRSAWGEFPLVSHSFKVDGVSFGALACSEVVSSTMYDTLLSDVLINVASHSWVKGTPLLFNQTLSMAKIHAVSAGKPYLQATNGAPNVVIIPAKSPF